MLGLLFKGLEEVCCCCWGLLFGVRKNFLNSFDYFMIWLKALMKYLVYRFFANSRERLICGYKVGWGFEDGSVDCFAGLLLDDDSKLLYGLLVVS